MVNFLVKILQQSVSSAWYTKSLFVYWVKDRYKYRVNDRYTCSMNDSYKCRVKIKVYMM